MISEYQEALNFLFEHLPSYQMQGEKSMTDLTKIRTLCAFSCSPQNSFKAIHVAGTNGKGSVCHLITSILMEAGYKVGLYTSPHLIDFTDRTQVGGVFIDQQFIINKVNVLIESGLVRTLLPSFFDVSVWIAFEYFKFSGVEYAVIETGLGGRKDTTNILKPILSVITSIGLDHQSILGHTLAEIAQEKAGIIKPQTPVVVSDYDLEYSPAFIAKAKKCNASLFWASQNIKIQEMKTTNTSITYQVVDKHIMSYTVETSLLGKYQKMNLATAIESIQVLNEVNLSLPINHLTIAKGINQVTKNTHLRGRWDTLSQQPLVIADGAHNPSALSYVVEQSNALAQKQNKKILFIYGVINSKDIAGCLRILPKEANYYFCQANYKRAYPSQKLSEEAFKVGLQQQQHFQSTEAALKEALVQKADDLIVVTGSLFVVGEALAWFR